MPEKRLLKIFMNPLVFMRIDGPLAVADPSSLPTDDFLAFACTPGSGSDPGTLAARYLEISEKPVRIFAAPAEERILEKLVWPLRHAKSAYMLGNYLGTVALCGLVAEMFAMLLLESTDFSINGKPMDEAKQKALFGTTFEKLGQEKRIDILVAYDVIDQSLKDQFDAIRRIRRRYLHLWSEDHRSLPSDAIAAFRAATELFVRIIGQDIDKGTLVLRPGVVKYLERRGQFRSSEE